MVKTLYQNTAQVMKSDDPLVFDAVWADRPKSEMGISSQFNCEKTECKQSLESCRIAKEMSALNAKEMSAW
jgi:hypothetical protein